MREIISIVLLFLCLNIFSQSVRFDTERGSMGVQTPHDWKVYGHVEAVLFAYPFIPDIKVSGYDMQMGYVWLQGDRATFRSAAQLTLWHVIPNEEREYNTYWTLVPVAFTTYPFSRDYLGVDLYATIDPYDFTFDTKVALIIRF